MCERVISDLFSFFNSKIPSKIKYSFYNQDMIYKEKTFYHNYLQNKHCKNNAFDWKLEEGRLADELGKDIFIVIIQKAHKCCASLTVKILITQHQIWCPDILHKPH